MLAGGEASEFGNWNLSASMQTSVLHDLSKEGCNGVVNDVGGTTANVAGDCVGAPRVKGLVARECGVRGRVVRTSGVGGDDGQA